MSDPKKSGQDGPRGGGSSRGPSDAQFDPGLASSMSVVLVIVVGLISFAQFHFLQRDED
jgi:hypothetical protein